jgi:glutamine cyclotransferase
MWLAGAWALAAATSQYRLQVVRVYPHDRTAFTQGLEYHDGLLYEGTGLEGRSRLRVERLENGRVIREIAVDPRLFGEGISVLGRRVYQLTWLGGKGFVYDATSFRRLREFSYPGQGWGLTNDGHSLYMSDGTAEIRVWDGGSLRELRRIRVHDGEREIAMLNELEWVRENFGLTYGRRTRLRGFRQRMAVCWAGSMRAACLKQVRSKIPTRF